MKPELEEKNKEIFLFSNLNLQKKENKEDLINKDKDIDQDVDIDIYTQRKNKAILINKTSDFGNINYDYEEIDSINGNLLSSIKNDNIIRKEEPNKAINKLKKLKNILIKANNIPFIISIIAIILSCIPYIKNEIKNQDSYLSDYLLGKYKYIYNIFFNYFIYLINLI